MTDRLAELRERIEARRKKDLTAWQSAQPKVTNHTCRHCGGYADRTEANHEELRIEWTCARCRSPTPESSVEQKITIPQAAQRYGYSLSYLRYACCNGELAVIRNGKYVYTTERAVRAWEGSRDQAKRQNVMKRQWRPVKSRPA